MDVAMEDRLAGDLADINADIEPLDARIERQNAAAAVFQESVDRALLLRLEIEIAGDMALGQDQRVQRRHRGGITNAVYERVLLGDMPLGHRAKNATGLVRSWSHELSPGGSAPAVQPLERIIPVSISPRRAVESASNSSLRGQ